MAKNKKALSVKRVTHQAAEVRRLEGSRAELSANLESANSEIENLKTRVASLESELAAAQAAASAARR